MAEVEHLLLQLLVPDTQVVAAAEAQIKQYLRTVECVSTLMQLMCNSGHEAVRQMSAVLLAKKINTHWHAVPGNTKQAVKEGLLQSLSTEVDRPTRRSVARLIAVLAKSQLPENSWPSLLDTLGSMATGGEPHQREAAYFTFHNLSETVANLFEGDHFNLMKDLFISGMRDTEAPVRVAAMRASVTMVLFVSEQEEVVAQFRDVIPLILGMCLETQDDELIVIIFEVLGQLAESAVPMLGPHLNQLMTLLLEVSANQQIIIGTREAAVSCIMQLVKHKPRMVARQELTNPILSCMLQLIATTSATAACVTDIETNDSPDEEMQQYQMAAACIDTMAQDMPNRFIFQPTVELCLGAMQHQEPAARKAGVTALGLIGEGCAQPLTQHLEELLPPVLNAARDSNSQVRENALFAIGQWSEHIPAILHYHEQILPVVFELLDEPGKVQMSSCYVLECFCENLDADVMQPYLNDFMTKLVGLLQTADPKLKDMVIAAISASAVGAEAAFLPYLEPVVSILEPLLELTHLDDLHLRGRALECLGHIALGVGAEHFQPYVVHAMQVAAAGLQLDNYELNDFTYTFFSNVARTLGREFTPFVEIVQHLLEVAVRADENAFSSEMRGADAPSMPEFADADDDEDDGHGMVIMHVRTSMLDMKTSAVQAIGTIATAVGPAFAPFLQPTFEAFQEIQTYFHEDVRKATLESLKEVTAVVLDIGYPEGVPAGVAELNNVTSALVEGVAEFCKTTVEDDESSNVVAQAWLVVQFLIESVGIPTLRLCGDWMLEAIASMLREEATCQQHVDEDDEEDATTEHDNMLDVVTDVIGAMAKVLGANFVDAYHGFLPLLTNYTGPNRTSMDRSMALGCMAEVSDALGAECQQFIEPMMPLILAGLADEDPFVQRNAAFCAGVVGFYGGDVIAPAVLALLQGLSPLLGEDIEGATRDNAAAAIARMIMRENTNVPVDQALPVLVAALPLREDMEENKTVYTCLSGMVPYIVANMAPLLPEVLRVTAAIVQSEDVDDQWKKAMAQAVHAADATVIQQALSQSPAHVGDCLRSLGIVVVGS